MENTKTLSVKQVAEELETRPEWVRRMIRSGEIKASNISKGKRPIYRIRKAVLDAFIEARTVIGVQED
ncbi:helix-turn-helix domain-containing protein [Desulfovibrio sp. UCD-KL4C]|uniref:helix-turn-helix domain-containing protein n=1 Tax=Desulfovibrio sp. UCD-KL4C TaxID=2578120 RepID=UPI0025C2E00A|nr:helix-turn-helix domain-containing protein [Desulfovibrio sp. UCD-KL4C]